MKVVRLYVLSLMLFGIVGCDIVKTLAPCSDGHCQSPVEAVSEMQALGATITPFVRPYPDDIAADIYLDEESGQRYVFSNDFGLYFSPAMDRAEVSDPDPLANGWSDHPYVYTFSKENDGAFNLLKPSTPSNSTLLEGTQFAPLLVTNDQPALIVFGNHILEGDAMIPLEATHIEIWFRAEREQEYALMKRINLDSFVAWSSVLKPRVNIELSRQKVVVKHSIRMQRTFDMSRRTKKISQPA